MLHLAEIVESAKHIFTKFKGNLARMLIDSSARSGGEGTYRGHVFDCFVDENRPAKIYRKSPNINNTSYGGSVIPNLKV